MTVVPFPPSPAEGLIARLAKSGEVDANPGDLLALCISLPPDEVWTVYPAAKVERGRITLVRDPVAGDVTPGSLLARPEMIVLRREWWADPPAAELALRWRPFASLIEVRVAAKALLSPDRQARVEAAEARQRGDV